MRNKDNQLFFSALEVAKIMKVSRATIASKVRKGLIKAEKIGKTYAIPREEIEHLLGESKELTEKEKGEINKAVERAVKEYGKAIRMLGQE